MGNRKKSSNQPPPFREGLMGQFIKASEMRHFALDAALVAINIVVSTTDGKLNKRMMGDAGQAMYVFMASGVDVTEVFIVDTDIIVDGVRREGDVNQFTREELYRAYEKHRNWTQSNRYSF